MTVEVWTTSAGIPGYTARQAERAEQEGWYGLGLVDSQNLAADPYVELGLAARATTTLRLATAVTNPHTRHAATAATAAATVQAESGGRMVLGIGRGDSALAYLGLAPAPVGVFRAYLDQLQGYLSGAAVPFVPFVPFVPGRARASSELGMAGGPTSSQIRWLAQVPKVPVDVAATGPKVIAAAAAVADRVTFAVGSSPTRVGWAIDQARAVRADIPVGVYVPVVAASSRPEARELISGGVASFARFSVMHGTVSGPASDSSSQVLTAIHSAYDMNAHFTHGSPQSAPLTDEVIDEFGIAGPPSYCVDRLRALIGLGVTKIVMLPGGRGNDKDGARASHRLLVDEVLPALS